MPRKQNSQQDWQEHWRDGDDSAATAAGTERELSADQKRAKDLQIDLETLKAIEHVCLQALRRRNVAKHANSFYF